MRLPSGAAAAYFVPLAFPSLYWEEAGTIGIECQSTIARTSGSCTEALLQHMGWVPSLNAITAASTARVAYHLSPAGVNYDTPEIRPLITRETLTLTLTLTLSLVTVTATPAPATLALVGGGLLLVGAAARRRWGMR